jgi:YD repeat-containing protein
MKAVRLGMQLPPLCWRVSSWRVAAWPALVLWMMCVAHSALALTATTTSITASANPVAVGQARTLTVTVSGTSPSGTVSILNSIGQGVAQLTLNNGVASYTYTEPTPGNYSLSAFYGGDSNNASSSSSSISLTANKAQSSTTWGASLPGSWIAGNLLTMSGVVGGYWPTGWVCFSPNNFCFPLTGSGSTKSGSGQVFFGAGTYNLQVYYDGDVNNLPSSSSQTQTLVVDKTTSTLTVTSSQNPATVNQSVTLTAQVSSSYYASGTVTFYDNGVQIGTATLNNSAIATFSTAFTGTGTHTITASFPGDANNTASSSTAVSQVVNTNASTTTALAANASKVGVGSLVTFTATVSPASASGSVTFYDGWSGYGTGTSLGTATLSGGTATLTTTLSSGGQRSITAVYGGDASNNTSASSSTTVTVSQVVPSGSPNPGSVTMSNGAVTLSAVVYGASPSGTVTFSEGATTLGTATVGNVSASSGSASTTAQFSMGGAHTIVATYSGDANNAATSATFVESFQGMSAVSLAASASSIPHSQPVSLTATVTGGSPSGTITFVDGGTPIGTATLSGGTASLTTSTLSVGSHTIAATYNGDSGNAASSSQAVTLTVTKVVSSLALTVSSAPTTAGMQITLTATATGDVPTGTVIFYDGTTVVGTAPLVNGVATLTYIPATAGAHNFSAVYGGDTDDTSSTSNAVTKNILPATIALTYNAIGEIETVAILGQRTLTFGYDAAHRLTSVTDSAGNKIVYTLDAMGNRTNESVQDASGTLVKNVGRIFDALGRLQVVTGASP